MGIQPTGLFLIVIAVFSFVRFAEIVARCVVNEIEDRMKAQTWLVAIRAPVAILVLVAALTPGLGGDCVLRRSKGHAWIRYQKAADTRPREPKLTGGHHSGRGPHLASLPPNWHYTFSHRGGSPVYISIVDALEAPSSSGHGLPPNRGCPAGEFF